MSTSWRLEWHTIRSAVSLQVYGLYKKSTVCTACYPLHGACRFKLFWCHSNTNDKTVQMTERCFGTTSAIAVQLIVHINHTLRATVICWRPLTDQLFQGHELLSITALSQYSQIDYSLPARLQTNPSSSFQWIHNGVEYIGRCKRQKQSRHVPLRRWLVPLGIASWVTWRCTRSL